jgi:hypothetical protein
MKHTHILLGILLGVVSMLLTMVHSSWGVGVEREIYFGS